MFNWLIENAQTLFSGIGVAAIGWLFYLFQGAKRRSQLPFASAGDKGMSLLPEKKTFDIAEAFVGRWEGYAKEVDCPEEEAFLAKVRWNFSRHGEKVTCHSCAKYVHEGEEITECFDLIGRVVYNRFLVLEYYTQLPHSLSFGTEILEIDGNGDKFTGRYIGYSTDRKRIATGVFDAKQAPNHRA